MIFNLFLNIDGISTTSTTKIKDIKNPERKNFNPDFIIFYLYLSNVKKLRSSQLNPTMQQHNRHGGFGNRGNKHVPIHQM